ncbi:uncharacterized protein B0J16DRAFT_333524 [Fusarium flagelliforme]|uniref:Uncharacterized protein n=1 Tax=Fusarium flagelliforme TaxID=2675880 RepID=A0A395MZ67_9HYPO|nr:uncharacterized protein B0J16DRAFT_333524 [Fusarium flagelliforme]KAH7192678.1 hypothetical protein B0J16DRAFT_333524 [Fusarium flagelliforme]RFN52519.1 hypothetical protein FIE12Z_3280 [Fusarium flagelliforme]
MAAIVRPALAKPAAYPKALPVVVAVGSFAIIASYVSSQLATTSAKFDRSFSKYNTPESEANRARTFDGAIENPRTSLFNILGSRQ